MMPELVGLMNSAVSILEMFPFFSTVTRVSKNGTPWSPPLCSIEVPFSLLCKLVLIRILKKACSRNINQCIGYFYGCFCKYYEDKVSYDNDIYH